MQDSPLGNIPDISMYQGKTPVEHIDEVLAWYGNNRTLFCNLGHASACGCGLIHDVLYCCTWHKALLKSNSYLTHVSPLSSPPSPDVDWQPQHLAQLDFKESGTPSHFITPSACCVKMLPGPPPPISYPRKEKWPR